MFSQRVRFPTWNATVPRDVTRSQARGTTLEGEGELYLPSRSATDRPAVLISEGLGGLKPSREIAYGQKLAEAGYVTLVVDTFGARRVAWLGDVGRALLVTTGTMVADAFAGLRYLQEHPAVRSDAISIVGFSYGGMVAMLTVYEQLRRLYLGADGPRFAGHVSYYGCSVPRLDDPTTTGSPVLLLVAELDCNVSLERTREIADDMRRGGSQVQVELFEGTFHQWDGTDLKKRHIPFALAGCRTRLGRDNVLRDEKSGRKITGTMSRIGFMLRNISFRGYDILRSESALERSDRLLYDFLARVSEGGHREPLPVDKSAGEGALGT